MEAKAEIEEIQEQVDIFKNDRAKEWDEILDRNADMEREKQIEQMEKEIEKKERELEEIER